MENPIFFNSTQQEKNNNAMEIANLLNLMYEIEISVCKYLIR
jgi:hypothetical protein